MQLVSNLNTDLAGTTPFSVNQTTQETMQGGVSGVGEFYPNTA